MTDTASAGLGGNAVDSADAPEPIVVRDRVLVMADGVRLPLVTWEPAGAVRATVIGLHAFGDFRLAFAEAGPALARRGFRVHAYDQRGFGDTDGRGRWHGWRRLVRDLNAVIKILRPSDGTRLFLLGESMGGGVALVATARFRPEPVDGVILVEPAVRRGTRLRLMWDVAFATLALVAPGYSRRLARGTHAQFTPVARERLGQDPRIVRFIRADAYKGLLSLADAASASTRRLRLPTLFLYGRADGDHPSAPVRAGGARPAAAGDGPSLPRGASSAPADAQPGGGARRHLRLARRRALASLRAVRPDALRPPAREPSRRASRGRRSTPGARRR